MVGGGGVGWLPYAHARPKVCNANERSSRLTHAKQQKYIPLSAFLPRTFIEWLPVCATLRLNCNFNSDSPRLGVCVRVRVCISCSLSHD